MENLQIQITRMSMSFDGGELVDIRSGGFASKDLECL